MGSVLTLQTCAVGTVLWDCLMVSLRGGERTTGGDSEFAWFQGQEHRGAFLLSISRDCLRPVLSPSQLSGEGARAGCPSWLSEQLFPGSHIRVEPEWSSRSDPITAPISAPTRLPLAPSTPAPHLSLPFLQLTSAHPKAFALAFPSAWDALPQDSTWLSLLPPSALCSNITAQRGPL